MTPHFTIYSILMLTGLGSGFYFWQKAWRKDHRLIGVYISAILGAVIGAKVAYLVAEGWMVRNSPAVWEHWLTGKSILGALLGGYAGVELAKRLVGYKEPTGDVFAIFVPLGITLGRVGCLLQGCCLGRSCSPEWWSLTDTNGMKRWPAVPVEVGFNLLFLGLVLLLRRKRLFIGQHFHIYLIAYGAFRFFHEYLRETPKWPIGFTGYQIIALGVAGWGAVAFALRAKPR